LDVLVNRQKASTLTGEVDELETQSQQMVINAGSGAQVTTASVRGASAKRGNTATGTGNKSICRADVADGEYDDSKAPGIGDG
jgi:hypothetical protein